MKRVEDDRLLRGAGLFSADRPPQAVLIARFYRSPIAHARIMGLDLDAARAAPGVVAVLTLDDVAAWLPGAPDALDTLRNADGSPANAPRRPPLARDRVRFAGEPIALVVATDENAADDAVERILADFDPLPVHLHLAPGGQQLHAEAPDNQILHWRAGDADTVDRAFAQAAHVIEDDIVVPRIHGMPMEPMTALGDFDAVTGHWTLVTPTQGAHRVRDELARHFLQIDPARLRVITPDVGGAFGLRIHALSEQAVLLAAAARLRRPIAWTARRLETTGAEPHSRGYQVRAALALAGDGTILGLRADAAFDAGAYVFPGARSTPTGGLLFGLHGPYRVPCLSLEVRGFYTNTTPTGPFRGAGQPEGAYVIEQLLDRAAATLGIDPVALRRRNLLGAADFPYRTASGAVVDSGNPPRLLDAALAHAGEPPAPPKGWLHGRGIALYMKINGMGRREECRVTLDAAGVAKVRVGSQSNGQGHATAYTQIAADLLEIPASRIEILQGDTGSVETGTGTGASSALQTTGSGVLLSVRDLLARARSRAASALQCDDEDLAYADGIFARAASNQTISLTELAETSELVGLSQVEISNSFTIGCHICDVAVDPWTGSIVLSRYVAMDDLGHIINDMIAEGQIHGGLAQGIGQALMESQRYDPETAQPLTLTFMDYAIPRATDIPEALSTGFLASGTSSNALGVRGAGEAGAMASMAATANAVMDALRPLGVERIDAPLTPNTVWTAITRAAEARKP
jgi:carbon-monoxide dehydrogenase large subunit